MERLGASDLRAMLDFVGEVRELSDIERFRAGILPGLARLVPCDLVGYNEVDLRAGTSLVVCWPDGALFEGVEQTLAEHAHQHPLILRQQGGVGSAATISDYLSRREFERTELYQDIYRRIDARDQIAIGISGDRIVGIALNRARRSFSARDRAVLDGLRPHLARALSDLAARAEAAALLDALEAGLERTGSAIVALADDGALAYAGPVGLALLDVYFPGEGHGGLPASVVDWLVGALGEPLVVLGARGRLTVRHLPHEDPPVLLLEEHRHAVLDLPALLAIGLTRRQAEVLSLVALGRRNEEIAQQLSISPRTVEKHVEQICERLAVRNRAGAVAEAISRSRAA